MTQPHVGDIYKYAGGHKDISLHFLILDPCYRDGYDVLHLELGEVVRRDRIWLQTHCRKVA